MALSGQRVVTLQKGPFSYVRTLDQIRNVVAMMNLPISMISETIGLCDTFDGASHYSAEEISVVRTIPNIKIINLTDETIAEEAAKYSLITKKPLYIRSDSYSRGRLYTDHEIDFERGFSVVREGTDIVFVSTGYYTMRMIKIAEYLEQLGISAGVIDLYGIPFDEAEFLQKIDGIDNIVSVEENVLQGGIGSLLLEVFNRHERQKRVKCIGIDFAGKYPSVFGSREYFMRLFGLSDKGIVTTILNWYGKKRAPVEKLQTDTMEEGGRIAGYGECLLQKEKIILVGAGDIGQKALNYFGRERVLFFADNNSSKWGTQLAGIPIIAVSELVSLKDDYDIVIATDRYYKAFGAQLLSLGVSQFYKFFSVFQYELEKEICRNKGNKIVIYGIGETTYRVLNCLQNMKRPPDICITEELESICTDFIWDKWLVYEFSEAVKDADCIIVCREGIDQCCLDGVLVPVIDSLICRTE